MLLNNPIVYLLDGLEAKSGMNFVTFTLNEVPKEANHKQPYMEQYRNRNVSTDLPNEYKYIYDPNLQFDFRVHERINTIKYSERKDPWITVIFNTGELKPQTNLLSQIYTSNVKTDTGFYKVNVRRMSVPMNLLFLSNDISYLYTFLGNVSMYWDRFVNFPYKQAVQYTDTFTENYDLIGQAMNITPKDITKLDTERRGTLVTAAYSFDMVYYQLAYDNSQGSTQQGHLLRFIDLRVLVVNELSNLNICPI